MSEIHPDTTDIEADDEEDTSDDDQAVFLGSHRADELSLIAKLSASTTSTPSPAVIRVKKRDSREFMRRKTLLLSPIRNRPVLAERQIRAEDYSDNSPSSSPSKPSKCSCSTPMKIQDASDLTLNFAQFHLSSPRHCTPQPEESGSDKENVPVNAPVEDKPEERAMGEVVVIGQGSSSDGSDDDVILDMGNLKLSDFSDPETGFEGQTSVYKHADHADSSYRTATPSPTPTSPSISAATSPQSSPVDLLTAGDTSNIDSPLPMARAGPVVIPVLSSHHFESIRAESRSPCRAIPPPIIPFPESSNDSIELPIPSSPLSLPIERDIRPLATPSASILPPPSLVEKGAKLLKESTTARPAAIVPTKSAVRVLTIRSQLDNALSSRMGALGPPQRSVSSTSTSSSSSTSSKSRVVSSSSSTSRSSAAGPTKPITTQVKPIIKSVMTSRPPVPVTRPLVPARQKPTIVPLASSTTKSLPRPALAAKEIVPTSFQTTIKSANSTKPIISSIPLKRPAPVTASIKSANVPSQPPRFAPVVPTRSALGQPSRNIHHQAPNLQAVPIFSVGVATDSHAIGRPAFRSPAKSGLMKRTFVDKSTPRKLGTPMRFGTPRQLTMSTPSTLSLAPPIHDVSAVPEPVSNGPPASATRQSFSTGPSSPPEPARGSSADHEEVSVQLAKPPSSPAKSPSPKKQKRPVGRPRKIPEPQSTTNSSVTVHPILKAKSTKIIPLGISEKELKATTYRNTIRNQVYHCAIDRQIVRQNGPRPPSPTSKIRTTAERDEEEKKQAREARANRRKGQTATEEEERPVIERFEQHRFPGDESDFETPRPVKKAKKEDKPDKGVKFDKGLTVIRDDGSIRPPSREDKVEDASKKGCLRTKAELDHLGNLHEAHRPIDNLKRIRVVVNAVFYDGEEPVQFSYSPSNGTRSKKK
ncbi:uncharacterized protein I206_106132 [Kwoniella pini CBS 10737]|uniref:Uncharacterized protein n=1 Tax=Kwoniella pini CBS 10737 TaxID=1296096 RepID=A0AAJ8MSV9_9TREE